jgi:F420-dependent oxidoreductase-like protein
MIALSIFIEATLGLTWPTWQRLSKEVERLRFAGLYRSDHFTVAMPANPDALELIVSLTFLADHTARVRFGSLVAPLSFRDPVMLARQAAALDDLSGGRMVLGVGAGWMEREHVMFGYELGNTPTRIARLGEGLEVIRRLLNSEGPVTYEGRFYQLREAALRPRPQRPGGPPLLVGGNGPHATLPLVARYADIWNAIGLRPEGFAERSAHLDALLRDVERHPSEVKRTVVVIVICARDRTELAQRIRARTRVPALRRLGPDLDHASWEALLDRLRASFPNCIVGTPEQVVEQIRAYEQAGVEELMVNWLTVDDIAGLQLLADEVLPQLSV